MSTISSRSFNLGNFFKVLQVYTALHNQAFEQYRNAAGLSLRYGRDFLEIFCNPLSTKHQTLRELLNKSYRSNRDLRKCIYTSLYISLQVLSSSRFFSQQCPPYYPICFHLTQMICLQYCNRLALLPYFQRQRTADVLRRLSTEARIRQRKNPKSQSVAKPRYCLSIVTKLQAYYFCR